MQLVLATSSFAVWELGLQCSQKPLNTHELDLSRSDRGWMKFTRARIILWLLNVYTCNTIIDSKFQSKEYGKHIFRRFGSVKNSNTFWRGKKKWNYADTPSLVNWTKFARNIQIHDKYNVHRLSTNQIQGIYIIQIYYWPVIYRISNYIMKTIYNNEQGSIFWIS
jgi:hypothetical protein